MRQILSFILAVVLILNFSFVSGSFNTTLVAEADNAVSYIPEVVDLTSREDFSIGVNIHRSSYAAYPEVYLEQQIHAVARMGSKWIRFGGYVPDDGDWTYLDTVVGLCNKYGLKIIMNIYPSLTINSEYITLFCETFAKRYNGKDGRGYVDIFQVLNEVDLDLLKAKWGGSSPSGELETQYFTIPVDGAADLPEYLEYFKAAEKGIHSKESKSKFMINFSARHCGMISYFLRNGLKLDVVGWDLYTNKPYDREASAKEMTEAYDLVEETIYERYNVPVILCETNVYMGTLNEADRLNHNLENYQTLLDNLYLAYNRPWIKAAVLYELLDEPERGVGKPEGSYGLIANPSGGIGVTDTKYEKPIYVEMQRLIGGNRNLKMIKRSKVDLKPYEKLVVDTADDSNINGGQNTGSDTLDIPSFEWDTEGTDDGGIVDQGVFNTVKNILEKITIYEMPWLMLILCGAGMLLLAGGAVTTYVIVSKKKAKKKLDE